MAPRDHAPSKLAGPWRSLGDAGQGATARVQRAQHERTGVLAALKLVAPAFLGEAETLAAVDRRWGPRLLDVGRDSSGSDVYLALEWVDGAPLDPAAVPPGQRERTAAVVAHGVARGLAELHAAGVRHGDVKPANVIVNGSVPTRDAAEARGATLIDLGLSTTTGHSALGGTPRYAAPELRAGEEVGPRADMYALGLVLAEILDPAVCAASDPAAAALSIPAKSEPHRWVHALLARAPGARPRAAWLGEQAAALLGLQRDPADAEQERERALRRAYVAVRARAIARATGVADEVQGAPRAWLEEVLAIARALRAARGASLATAQDVGASGPLDRARLLVQLVGPGAAAWTTHEGATEQAFVARLVALARAREPSSWTRAEVVGGPAAMDTGRRQTPPGGADRTAWLVRALMAPAPGHDIVALAEGELSRTRASSTPTPPTLAIELAGALARAGELGRAAMALDGVAGADAAAGRAELARRAGDAPRAAREAERASADPRARSQALATLARIAWDRGDLDGAERHLVGAAGPAVEEVRALVAYARGRFDEGVAIVREALAEAPDAMAEARLAATLGMLADASGDVDAALTAFGRAAESAARTGAIVEEATYRVGEAMAAGDAGDVRRALESGTRAALLFERLGRAGEGARAWLTRASALSAVGDVHGADDAADRVLAVAEVTHDARAEAYARWARAECRDPGDPIARAEVACAARLLEHSTDDDRVRAAARALVWAPESVSDAEATSWDAAARHVAAPARWEWWGARAHGALAGRTNGVANPVSELVALAGTRAPLASIGPALAYGAELARRDHDGQAARRLDTARRSAAERLIAHTPAEQRATIAGVFWVRAQMPNDESALAPAQIAQLETIVRSLATRDRLKPLLEQVLDAMVLWTGVERGLLLLRGPQEDPSQPPRLVPRAARNLAREDLHGEQLVLSRSIAQRAMDSGELVVDSDAFATLGDLHASVHALRLRSVLAVPLIARGEKLGVVYLDDRARRGAFGPQELAWVRLVASQAAMAIADARDQVLLRRAARTAERARARADRLLAEREVELVATRSELERTKGDTRYPYDAIAGRSEPMRQMLRVVDRLTASDVPVLIVGESGTGKELVARAMHQNGPRRARRFVGENCASVPESLLESTLFGHVKGSFTGATSNRPGLFEIADGGTLFLDEIGEMPLSMQSKLLRVLQEGEIRPVGGERTRKVDVRLVAATHRDLAAMVEQGSFREDLFYRLNVVTVSVPPLRERAEDIPLLVAHLVSKHAGVRNTKVTRAALEKLCAYPWPGNVRQLENEVRRAIVLADGQVDVGDLSPDVARGGPGAARGAGLDLRSRLDALEKELAMEALSKTRGNQTKAAELLGVSRFGLQKMIKRLGIER